MTAFARFFRADINRHVEYSFDKDSTSLGTMVVGAGKDFLVKVQRFSRFLPHGQIWTQDIEKFVKYTKPQPIFCELMEPALISMM